MRFYETKNNNSKLTTQLDIDRANFMNSPSEIIPNFLVPNFHGDVEN